MHATPLRCSIVEHDSACIVCGDAAAHPGGMDPLALFTPAEMALADAAAPALGASVAMLMEAAGAAVAAAIVARFAPVPTLVLCGPGNNGGDGLVAAERLRALGWPVAVARFGAFSAEQAAGAGLVVDAVFGAGLSRDVSPEVARVLVAARRLVAVDVPSGLDGATGGMRGFAPRAELTVTFVARKPGHLLLPGRALCGEVVCADIGMPAAALPPARAWENGPGLWRLPRPGGGDHKFSRGHVTILGGAEMTGAARLAAGAARRVGAGLVSIAAMGRGDVYRAGAPGLLVSEAPVAMLLEDRRRTVWLAGPGLGVADAAREIPPLLAAGRTVVVDADGLRGAPESFRGAAVLTPHLGEFSRVFGAPGADRPAAVRAAAAVSGAVVVLKGADTIIAAPDGRVAINTNAPPWLATAGAGDVLAGIIAGLLAQGMAAFPAACAGVWLHGAAAGLAGPGLIAEDLAPLLARAAAGYGSGVRG